MIKMNGMENFDSEKLEEMLIDLLEEMGLMDFDNPPSIEISVKIKVKNENKKKFSENQLNNGKNSITVPKLLYELQENRNRYYITMEVPQLNKKEIKIEKISPHSLKIASKDFAKSIDLKEQFMKIIGFNLNNGILEIELKK